MAATAFTLSGADRRRQKSTGQFGIGGSYGGFCEVTAEHSGVGNFAVSSTGVGYFIVTLEKNGEAIATGSFDGCTGFDNFLSGQYRGGGCSIAMKVKKGDVLKFSCGANNDSGNGTLYWSFVVFG